MAGDRALSESDVAGDPFTQFAAWFAEAEEAGQPEPEAMALATTGPDGAPQVRFVLMRGFDARGFVFHTNYNSRKGEDLATNPAAALAFRWWTLGRQVRITGPVARLDAAESDSYFATRPRGAQLGAWASAQSEPIGERAALERQLAEAEARYAGGAVPRPPYWGGYRVAADSVEFWQGRPDRLHDRLVYTRAPSGWSVTRLSP